jgi:hypothetical protein
MRVWCIVGLGFCATESSQANFMLLRIGSQHIIPILNVIKERLKIKFKNSVRTSKRTPHFTVTKINRLMLFKEIIAVYGENNHPRPVNAKCRVIDC